MLAYVDASALVKLVLDEVDAGAMRRWYIEAEHVLCSVVGLIETRRAVARKPVEPAHLDRILQSVEVIRVDDRIARRAAQIGPPAIRTLDAIHLASAQELAGELDAFVTFDDRLADAARMIGLAVVRPA